MFGLTLDREKTVIFSGHLLRTELSEDRFLLFYLHIKERVDQLHAKGYDTFVIYNWQLFDRAIAVSLSHILKGTQSTVLIFNQGIVSEALDAKVDPEKYADIFVNFKAENLHFHSKEDFEFFIWQEGSVLLDYNSQRIMEIPINMSVIDLNISESCIVNPSVNIRSILDIISK